MTQPLRLAMMLGSVRPNRFCDTVGLTRLAWWIRTPRSARADEAYGAVA